MPSVALVTHTHTHTHAHTHTHTHTHHMLSLSLSAPQVIVESTQWSQTLSGGTISDVSNYVGPGVGTLM